MALLTPRRTTRREFLRSASLAAGAAKGSVDVAPAPTASADFCKNSRRVCGFAGRAIVFLPRSRGRVTPPQWELDGSGPIRRCVAGDYAQPDRPGQGPEPLRSSSGRSLTPSARARVLP